MVSLYFVVERQVHVFPRKSVPIVGGDVDGYRRNLNGYRIDSGSK